MRTTIDISRIMKKKIEVLPKYLILGTTDRNKFAFGVVMQVNGMNYYVSVSSFDKKQEANILIRVPGDEKEIKGSLRFNYMIPVPEECMERLVIKDVKDEKYRLLLNKEYQFCMEAQFRFMCKRILLSHRRNEPDRMAWLSAIRHASVLANTESISVCGRAD